MSTATLYVGNALSVLRTLDAESVQCCVTSPPYWGLRDYGEDGQMGLEKTPEEYVAKIVEVFREVRRVLKPDGTLWLNLGDSYGTSGGDTKSGFNERYHGKQFKTDKQGETSQHWGKVRHPTKPKDLVGIPWRVAFALQADGWWLRSDIVWSKPNPMPESVRDRPTKAHEYVFLMSKSERYFYDADAIREDMRPWIMERNDGQSSATRHTKPEDPRPRSVKNTRFEELKGANARSVWTIPTKPYPEAHFATFPPELAERCIKAGSAPGDTVLDPFGGSGTTAAVATGHGREAVHIDLTYHELAEKRIGPMFCVNLSRRLKEQM